MRRFILALLAAICFPGLAHSSPSPGRVMLVAQDLPGGSAPAEFRVLAMAINEPTCWQLAKLAGNGAPAQVFFCMTPEALKGGPPELKNVPPIVPRGKTV